MQRKNFKKAYSLIELSIVILIISILITGALSVSVGSANNAKIKTTNDRITQVYRAIGNFLVANRRLPCPASILKIKTVDTDYGSEVGAGAGCAGAGVIISGSSANLAYGMVPVRSLGLANDMAEDGFESKLAYIVDINYASNAVVFSSTPDFVTTLTFGTAGTANINITEKPSGISQLVASDAVIALISYGANKSGAYNANSASQNTRSSDTDEQDNDTAVASPYFNNSLIASSTNSDVFDDIIFFKRRNDIVDDFKAMFLIACNGASATPGFTSSLSAYYGQTVSNTACVAPATQYRKCEAYGTWVNITNICA